MTLRTLMPCYTWAGDDATYDARAAQLKPGDIAIVTSTLSGPSPFDPALHAQIVELDQADVLVFGYVACDYGERSLREILADITLWRHDYAVRRVFLDEWAADMHNEIGLMWGAVRGYGGRGTTDRPILAVNPGITMPLLRTVPPGTLVVTHEGTAVPPPGTPQPWEAALVHSHPRPDACRVTLERDGWGWGYCTSDGLDGNPFDEPEDNR